MVSACLGLGFTAYVSLVWVRGDRHPSAHTIGGDRHTPASSCVSDLLRRKAPMEAARSTNEIVTPVRAE